MCALARSSRWLGLPLLTLAAVPAFAVDGAIEINAAAALAGNVTALDSPGYPVTISTPGRYVLTGDLVLSSASTTGIEITADAVTLDLNDFSIRGITQCTVGPPLSCSPTGAGVGIVGSGAYTVVRNGRVLGMGGDCIRLANGARVERVTVADCGDDGIETGVFATLRDVLSDRSADAGLFVGGSSRVIESQVYTSGSTGIRTGNNALVIGNQVAANGLGILASDAVVRGNSVVGNQGSGIVVDGAASVVGNVVARNTGNAVSGLGGGNLDSAVVALNALVDNDFSGVNYISDVLAVHNVSAGNLDGIGCADLLGIDEACAVLENTIVRNSQSGISGPAHLGYSTNVLNANGVDVSSTPAFTPIEFGTNVCSLNTTCP